MCLAAGSWQTLHFSVGEIKGFGPGLSPELFFRGFLSGFPDSGILTRFVAEGNELKLEADDEEGPGGGQDDIVW